MRELNVLRKQVEKLQAKSIDDVLRFRLKDGSVASISANEMAKEDSVYANWVHHNADAYYRCSDGSTLHSLSQAVCNTLEVPFVPWEEWRELHPVLAASNEINHPGEK